VHGRVSVPDLTLGFASALMLIWSTRHALFVQTRGLQRSLYTFEDARYLGT